MPNALASETSPYLLQHKDNPVDWRPWSADAFAQAQRRDVPVFLSVGYSTCYWCHVMEREVFENETLARQMNDGFVCVKVDREERPDVDEHYMTATQVLSGQGGWPMSVFLTPDGKPFFAGTYFPPHDMQGRPGFGRIMETLTDAWQNRRDELLESIDGVADVLMRLAKPRPPEERTTFDASLVARLTREAAADYDPSLGGFGRAPKFPRQTLLAFLLEAGGHEKALQHTLSAMANGGIRDHLGGGFHRYSTDAKWLVPHFEIMLYDQAMLAPLYADAAGRFDEPRFAEVARGCCDFVLREMTSDAGAFFTAFDAEVDGSEGKNYLWTPDEIRSVLGDEADDFLAIYGLDRGFNFADPHGPNPHTPDANVLFLAEPDRENEAEPLRQRLLAIRKQRQQPLLDTKIVTSWNGLMAEALAACGKLLDEPRYVDAADKAVDWLLANHIVDGRLIRSSRDGTAGQAAGVLEDYAHLASALVTLNRRDEAEGLLAVLNKHFKKGDAYAATADDDPDHRLMGGVRRLTAGDTPLPSGNGMVAITLLRLGRTDDARKLVETFAGPIVEQPGHASVLAMAASMLVPHGDFTVEPGPAVDAPQSPPAEAGQVVQLAGEWIDAQQIDVVLTIAEGFHLYSPRHKG
ncbi:MAG: thioredoxin domain-containing protein, partial [Planctomycetota bacterium]